MDNHAIWEKIYTDRPEDVYVHSANFRWEAYLTRSILKNIPEIDSVIDVGCGEGIKTRLLSDIFPAAKIIGVDLSETGIEKAKNTTQNESIQYICDDVTNWCYNGVESGGYSLVTSFFVLEHIEDWESMLKTICRLSSRYVLVAG